MRKSIAALRGLLYGDYAYKDSVRCWKGWRDVEKGVNQLEHPFFYMKI